jgi:hypothetical protein
MGRARYLTGPVWNNPETEAAHNSAFAIPYFESVGNDSFHDRKTISPHFGPAKGETWKCDDDVQYWKQSIQGNLYSPNKDQGFRLRASNGNVHDGFVEVGYISVGSTSRGNCMWWPIATGSGTKDGVKGCSFRIQSTTHSSGGTNSESTNRWRHNTWLRAVAISILGVRADNGKPMYESGTKWWGSSVICTNGDQAGGNNGKFVTFTFTDDMFAEAARLKSLNYMPLCTSVVFQLWTGYRDGINTGSTDSTLSIYDFKLHYAFSPQSENNNKCLLLPAWTYDAAHHFGVYYDANGHAVYNNHVRLGFEG